MLHHTGDPVEGMTLCGIDLADRSARHNAADHADFIDERVNGPRCPTCAIACAGRSENERVRG